MTNTELQNNVNDIKRYAANGRLRDAFSHLRNLSERLMTWEITSSINSLEQSYRYMLDYASKGTIDPGRDEIYHSICEGILTNTDRLLRHGLRKESPTLYYNTLRYEGMKGGDTIASLLKAYNSLDEQTSLFNIVADGSQTVDSEKSQREREDLEKRLFDRIWVSFPLHQESVDAIKEIIESGRYSVEFIHLLLCAITLGELEFHDENRLLLLMDAYGSLCDKYVSMAALTGVLLGLNLHRNRTLSVKAVNRLAALKDSDEWSTDVKNIFLELIRAKDTERITKKLRDEVIPQMLKLRPDISKKFNASEGVNIGDFEENPEWQELLDKSGITDKLKELSELQEEGADVLMGAFSQLKSYPFFNQAVNWFRIFSSNHSSLSNNENSGIMEMIALSPILCDSDKYSFALSVNSLPEMQRKMMLNQLEAQGAQLDQIRLASEMTKHSERKTSAKMFIQNLYRFFKLFRRKGEFNDPFSTDLNLTTISYVNDVIGDSDTLGLAAEFYFKRRYWREALDTFNALSAQNPPSPQLFQKIGYCQQKLGDILAALDSYEQAELIDSESHWTLRRLAMCHRMLGNIDKALHYYQRLVKFYPNDVNLAMNYGHTLLEAGREKEATEQYYKADYLDADSSRAWRPLAWSLLLTGDFKRSRKYYEKILSGEPTADDYLNMGHLALAESNFKESVGFYNKYIELCKGGVESFIEAFKADYDALVKAGIDRGLLPLIIDAILYERN